MFRLFWLIFIQTNTIYGNSGYNRIRWEFVYWEAPPFIYTGKDGNLTGILPEVYRNVPKACQMDLVFVPKVNLQNYTLFGSLLKKNTSEDYSKEPLLKNADGRIAAWVPVLNYIAENSTFYKSKNTAPSAIFDIKEGVAVFALREKISFTYKVYQGMKNSAILFLISTLLVLSTSVIIWLCERHSNPDDFNRGFTRGVSNSIWVSCYTMVTVGYGDSRVTSIVARILSIVWMVSSIIIAALLTGTIYDSIKRTRYLDVKGKKVGGLAGSMEAYIVKEMWQADIQEYDSFEEILDAVRYEEVPLAIMNYYSAGYYSTTMNQDQSKPALSIVAILPSPIPVNILSSHLQFVPNKSVYYCFSRELVAGIERGRFMYRRKFKEEQVYYAPLSDLLSELNSWTACLLVCTILIVVGFGADLGWLAYHNGGGICGKLKNIKLKSNKHEPKEEVEEKVDNSKSLEDYQREFVDMMRETTVIRQQVFELLQKFNQPIINNNTITQ